MGTQGKAPGKAKPLVIGKKGWSRTNKLGVDPDRGASVFCGPPDFLLINKCLATGYTQFDHPQI